MLRQQNMLLKEPLTTQAQSHIQHLQQTMAPPPVASNSSSSHLPPSTTPAPAAKSEPTPAPPTINLTSTLREFQEKPKKENEPLPQLPSQVPPPFPFQFPPPGTLQPNTSADPPHLSAPAPPAEPKAPPLTPFPRSPMTQSSPSFSLPSQASSTRRRSKARSVDKRAISVPRSPQKRSRAKPRRSSRPRSTRRRPRSTHGHSPPPSKGIDLNCGPVHALPHLLVSTVRDQLLIVALNQFAFKLLHHLPRNQSQPFLRLKDLKAGNLTTHPIVLAHLETRHATNWCQTCKRTTLHSSRRRSV